MSKHTPGPWRMNGSDGQCRVEALKAGQCHAVIVDVVGGNRLGECLNDFSEVEANARLIARAPEMLEALESISKLHDHEAANIELSQNMYEAACIARAAIAKYRG